MIQDLPEPKKIEFGDAGSFTISRMSRPILKVKIPVGGQVVTVFNCHLKSKLGEFDRNAKDSPANLLNYDAVERALGSLRAGLRRMAEAWVLRREIVKELDAGNPVMVLGDLNDSDNAVSSEIITGETPFKNYSWIRRHNPKHSGDRHSDEENIQIQEDISSRQLHSAEKMFVKKPLRDMVYTSAFGGVFESIDQILLSRHFLPDHDESIGEQDYFRVFNDHLTDASHPEAPHNKLASDHGQIVSYIRMHDGK